jgi:hypothetical protein
VQGSRAYPVPPGGNRLQLRRARRAASYTRVPANHAPALLTGPLLAREFAS